MVTALIKQREDYKPLILVVDDDQDNLLFASYIVELLGMNCIVSDDSRETLFLFKELLPDFSSIESSKILIFSTLFSASLAKADAKIEIYFLSVQVFLKINFKNFQEVFCLYDTSRSLSQTGTRR